MALEKKKQLRNIEFTFTNGEVHPECHCVYHEVIEEDGMEIAKNVLREVNDSADTLSILNQKEQYIQPEI